MQFLRNLPIKRKLVVITMIASSFGILLACLSFAGYETFTFRERVARDVAITARMVGDNCSAALLFNEPSDVEKTLQSLRAHPRIVRACVYKEDRLFAQYRRGNSAQKLAAPALRPNGYQFVEGNLELFQSIETGGEVLGSIYIQFDLSEIAERTHRYAGIVLVLMLTCSIASLLLVSLLQRVISRPILDLSRTAGRVARERDYSVRAVRETRDEIGDLVGAFNEMLTEIQQRDQALRDANDTLERRVSDRTRELAQSQALYLSLVEHLPMHIFRKDLEGRIVFANTLFCKAYRTPLSEMIGKTIYDVASPDTAARVTAEDRWVIETGNTFDQEQTRPDLGNDSYYQVVKSPVRGPDGTVVGIQGMHFNITARKRAEAELKELHTQLLDASRRAGMAQVATGVLHNVGNVLTSVNVSTTLLAEQIKNSKLPGVGKTAALMQSHENDLGSFFSEDPRAKRLPGYLTRLTECLEAEQGTLLKEIGLLTKHIEHIKEIVAMQQSYAKVSGVNEVLPPVEVVEDAIRINGAALVRHDVHLERAFEEGLPRVSVDRHKVLQILINLVSNAKYAMDAHPAPQKVLRISIERSGEAHVKISVADNGVGISAENLNRIFEHGFTTKRNGHGFGLHSSANAARELGGSLKAASAGFGQGATFSLRLPVELQETKQVCSN